MASVNSVKCFLVNSKQDGGIQFSVANPYTYWRMTLSLLLRIHEFKNHRVHGEDTTVVGDI